MSEFKKVFLCVLTVATLTSDVARPMSWCRNRCKKKEAPKTCPYNSSAVAPAAVNAQSETSARIANAATESKYALSTLPGAVTTGSRLSRAELIAANKAVKQMVFAQDAERAQLDQDIAANLEKDKEVGAPSLSSDRHRAQSPLPVAVSTDVKKASTEVDLSFKLPPAALAVAAAVSTESSGNTGSVTEDEEGEDGDDGDDESSDEDDKPAQEKAPARKACTIKRHGEHASSKGFCRIDKGSAYITLLDGQGEEFTLGTKIGNVYDSLDRNSESPEDQAFIRKIDGIVAEIVQEAKEIFISLDKDLNAFFTCDHRRLGDIAGEKMEEEALKKHIDGLAEAPEKDQEQVLEPGEVSEEAPAGEEQDKEKDSDIVA